MEKNKIVPKIIECSKLINEKEEKIKLLNPLNDFCSGDVMCDDFFNKDKDIGKYIDSLKDSEKKKNKIWEILIKNAYKRYGIDFVKSDIYLLIKKYVTILKSSDYADNTYYKDIKIDTDIKIGKYLLTKNSCLVGEIMAYDLGEVIDNNISVPKLGIWEDNFEYPVLGENGNAWMTITPNEINTMKEMIGHAHGRVLTFGLGLGYFSYMTSLKDDVESITIIEKSKEVIEVFKKVILPQFKTRAKINIIEADLFDYVKGTDIEKEFDYAFVDIWQDCTEVYLYLKTRKALEKVKKIKVDFWISSAIEQILLDEILFDYSELLLGNENGHCSSIDEPILIKKLVKNTLRDLDIYNMDIKGEVLNLDYMLPKILAKLE